MARVIGASKLSFGGEGGALVLVLELCYLVDSPFDVSSRIERRELSR